MTSATLASFDWTRAKLCRRHLNALLCKSRSLVYDQSVRLPDDFADSDSDDDMDES